MAFDTTTEQVTTIILAVVALSLTYAKVFSGPQVTLTQWVIDGFGVKKRYKGLTCLGVGLVMGIMASVVVGGIMNDWRIIPVGIFAGFLGAVEGGREYDLSKVEPPKAAGPVMQAGADAPKRTDTVRYP